jgi:hypothetical protein
MTSGNFFQRTVFLMNGVDRDSYPERVPTGVSDDPDCPAVSVDGQLFIAPPTTRQVADALQLQTGPIATAMTWWSWGLDRPAWPPAFRGVLKG